jgi:hypothetical protein
LYIEVGARLLPFSILSYMHGVGALSRGILSCRLFLLCCSHSENKEDMRLSPAASRIDWDSGVSVATPAVTASRSAVCVRRPPFPQTRDSLSLPHHERQRHLPLAFILGKEEEGRRGGGEGPRSHALRKRTRVASAAATASA